MFDIGFWEVIFILVIALLVVGPERLPRVARTAGLWLGKVRGFVSSVKADIDRELAAEELKRTLAKQASVPEIEEIIEETGDAVRSATRQDAAPEREDAGAIGEDSAGPVPGREADDKHA